MFSTKQQECLRYGVVSANSFRRGGTGCGRAVRAAIISACVRWERSVSSAGLMATLKPFAALRPKPELAGRICELPYDGMSSEEARQIAAGHPLSFLHGS